MRLALVWTGIAAATAVAILALAAAAAETSGSESRRHVVEIRQLAFDPPELVVRPGDVVVWINRDFVPHTATADDGSWDSNSIDTDGTWQTVVTAATAETYFCRFHPTMTGRLRIDRDGRSRTDQGETQ